ncbi:MULTISPECIES: hypothetical protein [Cupriavidus]|uniref:hypothetical protein n=1 Tax=Cupriavidus sp. DF5525 TaxID=3160989 RepID=UPI0003F8A745
MESAPAASKAPMKTSADSPASPCGSGRTISPTSGRRIEQPDLRRCGRYGIARMAARSLSPALETFYAFTREHWKELSSAPAGNGARR